MHEVCKAGMPADKAVMFARAKLRALLFGLQSYLTLMHSMLCHRQPCLSLSSL